MMHKICIWIIQLSVLLFLVDAKHNKVKRTKVQKRHVHVHVRFHSHLLQKEKSETLKKIHGTNHANDGKFNSLEKDVFHAFNDTIYYINGDGKKRAMIDDLTYSTDKDNKTIFGKRNDYLNLKAAHEGTRPDEKPFRKTQDVHLFDVFKLNNMSDASNKRAVVDYLVDRKDDLADLKDNLADQKDHSLFNHSIEDHHYNAKKSKKKSARKSNQSRISRRIFIIHGFLHNDNKTIFGEKNDSLHLKGAHEGNPFVHSHIYPSKKSYAGAETAESSKTNGNMKTIPFQKRVITIPFQQRVITIPSQKRGVIRNLKNSDNIKVGNIKELESELDKLESDDILQVENDDILQDYKEFQKNVSRTDKEGISHRFGTNFVPSISDSPPFFKTSAQDKNKAHQQKEIKNETSSNVEELRAIYRESQRYTNRKNHQISHDEPNTLSARGEIEKIEDLLETLKQFNSTEDPDKDEDDNLDEVKPFSEKEQLLVGNNLPDEVIQVSLENRNSNRKYGNNQTENVSQADGQQNDDTSNRYNTQRKPTNKTGENSNSVAVQTKNPISIKAPMFYYGTNVEEKHQNAKGVFETNTENVNIISYENNTGRTPAFEKDTTIEETDYECSTSNDASARDRCVHPLKEIKINNATMTKQILSVQGTMHGANRNSKQTESGDQKVFYNAVKQFKETLGNAGKTGRNSAKSSKYPTGSGEVQKVDESGELHTAGIVPQTAYHEKRGKCHNQTKIFHLRHHKILELKNFCSPTL